MQRQPVQRPLPSLADTAAVTDTSGLNNSIDTEVFCLKHAGGRARDVQLYTLFD